MPDTPIEKQIEKQIELSIIEFKSRASKLRKQSNWFLALVSLALLGGVFVFIFAPDIANTDINKKTVLERIQEQETIIRDAENSFKIVLDENSDIQRNFSDSLSLILDPHYKTYDSICNLIKSNINDIIDQNQAKVISSLEVFEPANLTSYGNFVSIGFITYRFKLVKDAQSFSIALKETGPKLDRLITLYNLSFNNIERLGALESQNQKLHLTSLKKDSLDNVIAYAAKLRNLIEANELKSKATLKDDKTIGHSNYPHLIQTNITRFGSILLILFFVKIIIPQYRYSLRLAAFYLARADALTLLNTGVNTVDFDLLSTTLTPNHEFGKAPDTPHEKMIDLFKLVKK